MELATVTKIFVNQLVIHAFTIVVIKEDRRVSHVND